ncbi:MAG: 5-oxoprolinase subunit PxpB [Litorimonas sp.]
MTRTHSSPKISIYGDHAILVDWETGGFSESINDTVHSLAENLRQSGKYIEVVPGYDSLVCVFDLATRSIDSTKRHIEDVLARSNLKDSQTGQLIEIPVHYGGTDGPDMDTICASAKLSGDDVIALHSQREYRVCMMGFIPGFTFLSPAPKKLHHPRLATPRAKVPAGSIGIANWQTGIYGLESPGGWQIIGRTPLSIFDAQREAPFLISAGDRVRFVPQ